ncbi:MAG: hypothetical protein Q9195_009187 [Heterodermia aff. obscurata]
MEELMQIVNPILTDLENSAQVRGHISKYDKGSSLMTIDTVITHQIIQLRQQLMAWNTKHPRMSPEPIWIARMIELVKNLSKENEEGPGIEAYKIEGLDIGLAEELKKLRTEDVAFNLKFYTESRARMNEKAMPNAAEQLGKRIGDGLRTQERTSWIFASTGLEVWII